MPDYTDTSLYPVWDDDGVTDVQSLFKNPYFVQGDAKAVGMSWYTEMADHKVQDKRGTIYLFDKDGGPPNTVYVWGPDIYAKILPPNGDMPYPVPGYSGAFPTEACEKFRVWYNQGGRIKKTDAYPGPNKPTPGPISDTVRPFVLTDNPVWDAQGQADDISMCFTSPCWIAEGFTQASGWRQQMMNFQYDASVDPNVYMDLQKYEHVKGWARNIYYHVFSQSMPLDPPYFPTDACEAIRRWYNAGCPQFQSDIGHTIPPTDQIPVATTVEPPFRVRKDINTLTPQELQAYRMQLLNLNTESVQNSVWQWGGLLHANWCLHYMQASFPWHRAHLLWLETQIQGPIPYWNFFSSKAADPTSIDSGLPQAFLDDTFVGTDGKTYPNPLRHAQARNGVSRASTKSAPLTEVQRAPQLLAPGPARDAYITDNVPNYLTQISNAVKSNKLGDPQGDGYPFTWDAAAASNGAITPQSLNDLTDDNNPLFYSAVQNQFDGLLEQAHDNFHGWSGPDMANNSFAAFDPLFWSFHANFDRIFENWIRTNDNQGEKDSVGWSSNFPLRPFVGREGPITVNEGDMFTYHYTTIGNMVINSKALGYTYALPGNPDYVSPATPSPNPSVADTLHPMVVFPNVKCTDLTYIIHVALNPSSSTTPFDIKDPGYVGSITRLGMGPDNGNNRCIKGYVFRYLDGSQAVANLAKTGVTLPPKTDIPLKIMILEDKAGVRREVPESEYKDWIGFQPLLIWAKPIEAAHVVAAASKGK